MFLCLKLKPLMYFLKFVSSDASKGETSNCVHNKTETVSTL